MGNPTPIILLFFIALIGLVYILSTCDWKPKASFEPEPTDGSHDTPAIAKALATSDQSTSAADNSGDLMTLQCPNSTPIQKITFAKYKCGDHHVVTDIKDIINPICKDNNGCTVQTSWDGSNVILSASSASNTFPTAITDPYPGCPKHLDISYSCESDQAQSKFINHDSSDSDSTIYCPGKQIHIESASYRRMHKVDTGINVLTVQTQSGIKNLLEECNGTAQCKIRPTGYVITSSHKTYFAINNKGCSYKPGCGWCFDGKNQKCPGVPNDTPNDPKELGIVYYCQ